MHVCVSFYILCRIDWSLWLKFYCPRVVYKYNNYRKEKNNINIVIEIDRPSSAQGLNYYDNID